jgi:hypothetical protein
VVRKGGAPAYAAPAAVTIALVICGAIVFRFIA